MSYVRIGSIVVAIWTSTASNTSRPLQGSEAHAPVDIDTSSGNYAVGAVGFVAVFGCAFLLTFCYITRNAQREIKEYGAPSEKSGNVNAKDTRVYPATVLLGATECSDGIGGASSNSSSVESEMQPSPAYRARRASAKLKAELHCSQGHALRHDTRLCGNTCDLCGRIGTKYRCSADCDWDACQQCWDAHRQRSKSCAFITYLEHAYSQNEANISTTAAKQKLSRRVTRSSTSNQSNPVNSACSNAKRHVEYYDALGSWVTSEAGTRSCRQLQSDSLFAFTSDKRSKSTPNLIEMVGGLEALSHPAQHGYSPDASGAKTEIEVALRSTLSEDISSRKKTFKFLCTRWHPDKHLSGDMVLATEVFQHLQEHKKWYLDEGAE